MTTSDDRIPVTDRHGRHLLECACDDCCPIVGPDFMGVTYRQRDELLIRLHQVTAERDALRWIMNASGWLGWEIDQALESTLKRIIE